MFCGMDYTSDPAGLSSLLLTPSGSTLSSQIIPGSSQIWDSVGWKKLLTLQVCPSCFSHPLDLLDAHKLWQAAYKYVHSNRRRISRELTNEINKKLTNNFIPASRHCQHTFSFIFYNISSKVHIKCSKLMCLESSPPALRAMHINCWKIPIRWTLTNSHLLGDRRSR